MLVDGFQLGQSNTLRWCRESDESGFHELKISNCVLSNANEFGLL